MTTYSLFFSWLASPHTFSQNPLNLFPLLSLPPSVSNSPLVAPQKKSKLLLFSSFNPPAANPCSLLTLAIYSPKERRCPWHWRKKNRPCWRVACLALKQEASRRLGSWTLRMKRFCHAWGKSLELLGEVQVGSMGEHVGAGLVPWSCARESRPLGKAGSVL